MTSQQRVIRVYADTSVFGGAFDDEFRRASLAFFEQVRAGRFQLVTSALVAEELQAAPIAVRASFDALEGLMDTVEVSAAALDLRGAYLEAGIVAPQWLTDALHVALATTTACAVIVSWNFRHIVNFRLIPLYNEVNTLRGHASIAIQSPSEVIADGSNDEGI